MAFFAGVNRNNIMLPRFQKIYVATAGFLFTDSTEGRLLGLRKPSKIGLKHLPVVEVAGMELLNAYEATGELDLLDTRFTTLKNFQLLSQDGFQMAIPLKTADGRDFFLNFIENTASVQSPNGTCLVSGEPTFEMTDKDRLLKVKISGKMYDPELTYQRGLISGLASSMSGGTSLGLASMTEDQTTYKYPGIQSVSVGGSTHKIGRANAPKLTMVGKKFDDDMRMLSISGEWDCTFEINSMQAWADEIAAAQTASTTDKEIIITTVMGETFTFTNCMSLQPDPEWADAKSGIKLIGKATIPYANVTWGATSFAATLAGYS